MCPQSENFQTAADDVPYPDAVSYKTQNSNAIKEEIGRGHFSHSSSKSIASGQRRRKHCGESMKATFLFLLSFQNSATCSLISSVPTVFMFVVEADFHLPSKFMHAAKTLPFFSFFISRDNFNCMRNPTSSFI